MRAFPLLVLTVLTPVLAAFGQATLPAVTSHSGRFMVTMSEIPAPTPQARAANAAVGLVELDPNLVAVSCERVRDAVQLSLGASAPTGRRIHVTIAPATAALPIPRLVSTLYRDGWQHHVTLPTPLDEASFVRALVNALLLHMVDGMGATTPAEIPQWLSAGLCRHVRAWNPHLLVRGNVRGLNHERRLGDPLEAARAALATSPALSFDELSWPGAAELSGARRESFEHSAHVFTHQLLRLRDGPALCRRFIGGLAGRLNWQTAFLQTYATHFNSLLAVEKWWAVHLVAFTGRDQWQAWPLDTALARLDEALRVEARVRADKHSVPTNATVSLQTVLGEWTGSEQRAGVQAAIAKLTRIRPAMPAVLVSVVDGYLAVLDTTGKRAATAAYGPVSELHSRLLQGVKPGAPAPVNYGPAFAQPAQPAQSAPPPARDLLRQLDALDAERAALRDLSTRATRATTGR